MKCHAHHDQDAVSTCDCNKGMCAPCTGRFTTGQCEACLLARNAQVKRNIVREWIKAASFGAGGVVLALLIASGYNYPVLDRLWTSVMYFVLFAAGSIGWRYLTAERGWTIVILNPFFFVLIGFIVSFKLSASVLIGLVVGPFRLWKGIKEVKFINSVELQVARGEI